MSDGSKAYEQALRCPTTTRASRTRLLWDTSRFLRAHGRLKTSLKALWFATTFSLRQAPSFRFLPLAHRDLNEIWEYIAQDNLDAAERLVERIEELCALLAERPQLGR